MSSKRNSSHNRISHDYQEITQYEPASSDASQENNIDTEEEERKPPQLPASVVAVNYRNNLDDNRSISSQRSESGYHSSGALSDGPTVAVYTATSSLRSVGSVGSHGSGGRDATATNTPTIFGSETRYSVAISSYPASETAKSDIATVCSGSVVEDIEISSVDMNVPQTPNNIFPSPHSERSVLTGTNFRRSVEFAPSSFTQQFHKQISVHQTSEYMRFSAVHPNADQAPASLLQNDMGPPLSRALLMQGGLGSAANSRAGSVRSFGSNGASQNSDVVAHVDTDDCGGSLVESVTDVQSIHSQEDIRIGAEGEMGHPASEYRVKEKGNETHPLLKNNSGHPNGRTSPGGTIYKGKGVRRYQGRYMNLPLKRFKQDSSTDLVDTVLEADKVMKEEQEKQRASPQRMDRFNFEHFDYRRGPGRSQSPTYKNQDSLYCNRGRSPSSGRKDGYQIANGQPRRNGYHDHQQHKYQEKKNGFHTANNTRTCYHDGYSRKYASRSRSRSRSKSPRRSRNNRRRWKQPGSRSCDKSPPSRPRWKNTNNHNETSPPSQLRHTGRDSDSPPGIDCRTSHSPRRRRW